MPTPPRGTPGVARACGLALALVAAAACRGPASVETSVEFQTERGVVRGVSTEDGVFALADTVPATGEVTFRYRVGNGMFDDVASLERRNDTLAVLAPKSSRPNKARFAGYPASRDDSLFLEVRTADHSDLIRCHLLDQGRRGDLLVLDERVTEFDDVVHHYVGVGVFAWRSSQMELVGILNGVYSSDPPALAFIGLDEMATLLPATSNYFVRKVAQPLRADFEYGVPRAFEGERPSASDPAPPGETAPDVGRPAQPTPTPAPKSQGH
jgi:hypothetical protein